MGRNVERQYLLGKSKILPGVLRTSDLPFTTWSDGTKHGFETERIVINRSFVEQTNRASHTVAAVPTTSITSLDINWVKDDGTPGTTYIPGTTLQDMYKVASNGVAAGVNYGTAMAGSMIVPKSAWPGHLVSIALHFDQFNERKLIGYDPFDSSFDPTNPPASFNSDAAVVLHGSPTEPRDFEVTYTSALITAWVRPTCRLPQAMTATRGLRARKPA